MSRTHIIAAAVTLAAIIAALAARAPAQAGGGGCHEPSTDARGVSVDIKEFCMLPTVLRVDVGETITWTNRDATEHTVTAADNSWLSGKDVLAHDATTSYAFDRAGVYPYYCAFHPGMVGAVVVGDGNAAAFPATAGGALPTAPASAPTRAQASSAPGSLPIGDVLAFAALGSLGVVLAGGVGWRLRSRRRD